MSRTLGEVTSAGGYDALIAIFRARLDELGITGETCGHLAGLGDGYTTRLLTRDHMKKFGPLTLGPILGVLGIRLVALVDEEGLAQISKRFKPATFRRWNAGGGMRAKKRPKMSYGFSNPDVARAARQVQILTTTAAKRSRVARNAARVRWRQR